MWAPARAGAGCEDSRGVQDFPRTLKAAWQDHRTPIEISFDEADRAEDASMRRWTRRVRSRVGRDRSRAPLVSRSAARGLARACLPHVDTGRRLHSTGYAHIMRRVSAPLDRARSRATEGSTSLDVADLPASRAQLKHRDLSLCSRRLALQSPLQTFDAIIDAACQAR